MHSIIYSYLLYSSNMIGLEYCLLHVQEPILYVVRKQHRHSPTHSTPIADFYIVAGIVYQAPDLLSIINSHMVSNVSLIIFWYHMAPLSRLKYYICNIVY